MNKSGSVELRAEQRAAIEALLVEPTMAKASERCGVSERTLYRWLNTGEFSGEFRQRRRQIFGQAVTLSQRYAAVAVQTLGQIMLDHSAPAMARVKAAAEILSFARQGIELEDLAHRLEQLEARTAMIGQQAA